MDIQEQASTYAAVYSLIKWGCVALAALLTWAVMWFCTPAGFFPGMVVAVIIAGLGIAFLRSQPDATH